MNVTELVVFVIYFVFMVGIGIYFFAKSKDNNEKDYFLGGRQMGPWVSALSAGASDMSAWVLMGLPASVYALGMGQIWIAVGLAIGYALSWIFEAPRLRKFSIAAGDSITIPQYLTNRFLSKSKFLQIICAIIFLVAYTIYAASSIKACGTLFSTVIGINETTAMYLSAFIIISYTFLGGFNAVCWTDFFQGILMLIALLAIPIVVVLTQNIDTTAIHTVYQYTDASGELVTCDFGSGVFSASWKEIVSGLGWGLGYFGMPRIIVRFMSIEKPSMIKKSAIVAIVWVVLALGAACAVAYLGRIFVGEELLTQGLQKTVFMVMSRKFFFPLASGLLLAAIMAACISTADSQLLVASSSFTSDIYKPIIRKDASDKEVLWIGRIVVIIVAVIAFLLASSKGSGAQAIMNLVENAWGCFGSAFGPTILLSLFWRRFNYAGAIAGVVTGAAIDGLWLAFLSGATGIYEIVPGFICSMAAAVIVSKLTAEPKKEVTDIFDTASNAAFNE